ATGTPAAPATGTPAAPATGTPEAPAAGTPVTSPPASATAGTSAGITVPTARSFPVVGSSLAARPSRCVATSRSQRVTAGEQATVRVVVRANGVLIRGAAVRVTTPDGTITKRSDRHGVVIFRVRPSRSGRLVIQADSCFGMRTIRVRPARVASRGGVSPQFTG
ncbi:MAG: hypothetical protein JWM31_355, partial [Solirubrobacterales bacterium]|nr:hypothetical protein [Solirubrobacterales bacterium]